MSTNSEIITKWHECRCWTSNEDCACSVSFRNEIRKCPGVEMAIALNEYLIDYPIASAFNELQIFPPCIDDVVTQYLCPFKEISPKVEERIRELIPIYKEIFGELDWHFHQLKSVQQNENDGIWDQYSNTQVEDLANEYDEYRECHTLIVEETHQIYNSLMKNS